MRIRKDLVARRRAMQYAMDDHPANFVHCPACERGYAAPTGRQPGPDSRTTESLLRFRQCEHCAAKFTDFYRRWPSPEDDVQDTFEYLFSKAGWRT